MLTEFWGDHLDPTDAVDDWIWHGFVRPGQITLMTGLPKTGKTTLLSHILAHRQTGTPLLDRPMRPGVTVVISEESRSLWYPRCQKLDFGRDVCFFFRPFAHRPTLDEFAALIGQLLDLKARRGVDLVVFDTLSRFLPLRCENSTESMQQALAPLTKLAEAGLATLLNHHPNKGRVAPGQAARGSIALPAFADILLELHPFTAGATGDRRRLLVSFSRNEETPPSLTLELSEDGRTYGVFPEQPDLDALEYWPDLRIVLEDAPEPLTRLQLRNRWPEGCPRPSVRTLWNWLNAACKENLVARTGTGHANDPFEYYLPSKMPVWLADSFWCLVHHYPAPASPAEASPPSDTPPADVDPASATAEKRQEPAKAACDADRAGFRYVSAEEAARTAGIATFSPQPPTETAPIASPQDTPVSGVDPTHAANLRWIAAMMSPTPAD
jgi:hypothetical protein